MSLFKARGATWVALHNGACVCRSGCGPSSWQPVPHRSAMMRVCLPALQVPALVASYPGPPAADGSPQVSNGGWGMHGCCRMLSRHMTLG